MNVETIAVIGAGAMGRGMACAAALGGYRTILEDSSSTALRQAIAWMEQTTDQAVTEGKIEARVRDAAQGNLSTAHTIEEAIRDADLIIETLPEEMEMKIELFTIFDRFAKPNAIFASLSCALSMTEIARVTFSADRCVGMRFCDPVAENSALELVKGLETSDQTIAICAEVGCRMGKAVVVVDEPAAVRRRLRTESFPVQR
jgi:3-hydroxybutyryl-CoA dehydrogenase